MTGFFQASVCFALLLSAVHSVRTSFEVTENVEADKSETDQLLEGPNFEPLKVKLLLGLLLEAESRDCGARLTSVQVVDKSILQRMSLLPLETFQPIGDAFGANITETPTNYWRGLPALNITGGQKLVAVAGDAGPFRDMTDLYMAFMRAFSGSEQTIEITFDAGLDLRSCWGGVTDLSGRDACGKEVLTEVMEDLATIQPRFDTAGKSGSTLITNARGFIIKNIKDDEEYKLTREIMKDVKRDLSSAERKSIGGCHASLMTPMCAVLAGPGDAQWLLMRKVEIPGATRKKLQMPDTEESIGWLDLKGPKFARYADGKSYWDKKMGGDVWLHKDAGFSRLFRNGLHLKSCGSQQTAWAMEKDAALLESLKMTDYSLFMQFYEIPDDASPACHCKDGAPTFPLVVDTEEGIRLSIGIIDYIERTVKSSFYIMSTMKNPAKYHNFWMRMWPMYFHLPKLKLSPTADDVSSVTDDRENVMGQVSNGTAVVALQKIKWSRGKSVSRKGGGKHTYYAEQVQQSSSKYFKGGSWLKVKPGVRGKVWEIRPDEGILDVEFEGTKGKITAVRPEQVLVVPA